MGRCVLWAENTTYCISENMECVTGVFDYSYNGNLSKSVSVFILW